MILLIDIGNTNTVIGVINQDDVETSWRIETVKHKTEDEYLVLIQGLFALEGLDPEDIEDSIVSSVVPELNEPYRTLLRKLCGKEPLFLGPGVKSGMPILLDNPREVGADRIANGVAAYDYCKGACLVIDFGTATTFDVVSAKGQYLGGAICPGPRMSVEALGRMTSKLHVVEIEKPANVIGKNTTDSIKSGIFYGYLGEIEGLIKRISEELGEKPQVIATGGLAEMFASSTELIHGVDKNLTLKGLKIIYERNRR